MKRISDIVRLGRSSENNVSLLLNMSLFGRGPRQRDGVDGEQSYGIENRNIYPFMYHVSVSLLSGNASDNLMNEYFKACHEFTFLFYSF